MTSIATKLIWETPTIGVIPDFLTIAECDEFIHASEGSGFEAATIDSEFGPIKREDIRNNSRVILDDVDLADRLWSKLRPHIPNPLLGRWEPARLNERFRFYKYQNDQQFDWHIDGTFRADDASESVLTFMIYLNSGFEGGETVFGSQDGPDYHEAHRIKPDAGTAIIFFHRVLHKGSAVRSGTKYVLRSDIMFKDLNV